MNSKYTKWIGAGILALIIVVDLILDSKDQWSFSRLLMNIMDWSLLGWLVPFVMGVLTGHFCWAQKKRDPK